MKKGVHLKSDKVLLILKDGSQILHSLCFNEKKNYKLASTKEHNYIFIIKKF